MNSKDFYRTYQADDSWSELSHTLIAGIQSLSPAHVLEFGCGTGKHLSRLHQIGICTLGVDISPMNVYKAIHKYDLPCVVCGDETYLRHFCNVDVCFTVSVLDHIEQADGIVLELQRIANKAVFLAETVDVPKGSEYYYPHRYENMGFEKLDFSWKSPSDGARYNIWRWNKV
jgi:SAM-dependent methyltransferase